jgi:predicted MPP superfamily phosphohydrolase
VHRAISGLVRISGLYGRGSANSRKLEITTNRIELAGLPPGFNGFRILQLTDMHLDSGPTVSGDLRSLLKDIDHDLCVITGDFRFATSGDYRKCLNEASKVVDILPNPIYAVLGNHDFIEMVTPLEEMGIQLLLNEATRIRFRGEEIWLAGVDDPHFYQTDDLQKARDGTDANSVAILLAHSPEIYRQAAAFGFNLMLCGHTHAGQICLPGGIPVVTNGNCPRQYVVGPWKFQELSGYTSRGVGCSGVPLRFNCPPEIVVHELQRAN